MSQPTKDTDDILSPLKEIQNVLASSEGDDLKRQREEEDALLNKRFKNVQNQRTFNKSIIECLMKVIDQNGKTNKKIISDLKGFDFINNAHEFILDLTVFKRFSVNFQ